MSLTGCVGCAGLRRAVEQHEDGCMYVLSEFLNFIFLKEYFLNSSDLILSQFSCSAKHRGVEYKARNVGQEWCKWRRGRHAYRSHSQLVVNAVHAPIEVNGNSQEVWPGSCAGQSAALHRYSVGILQIASPTEVFKGFPFC